MGKIILIESVDRYLLPFDSSGAFPSIHFNEHPSEQQIFPFGHSSLAIQSFSNESAGGHSMSPDTTGHPSAVNSDSGDISSAETTINFSKKANEIVVVWERVFRYVSRDLLYSAHAPTFFSNFDDVIK